MKIANNQFLFQYSGASGILGLESITGHGSHEGKKMLVIRTRTIDKVDKPTKESDFQSQWGIVCDPGEALEFAAALVRMAVLLKGEGND